MQANNQQIICLGDTIRCFKHLYTALRDKESSREVFINSARRIMTIISEEGLASIGSASMNVVTPTGASFEGSKVDTSNIVAVSIIRAGDSMLDTFLSVVPQATVGKILIQRNEETAEPIMYYSKLPDVRDKKIFLLDPMLATGGSAKAAIRVLIDKGAEAKNIIFLNVLACPEGVASMQADFPEILIITGAIDEKLNEKKYILPGLGDFGDRYFGTC